MGSKLNWLLILVVLGIGGCESSEEPKALAVADTVYVNGSVYTMDESQPWASALASCTLAVLSPGTGGVMKLLTSNRLSS